MTGGKKEPREKKFVDLDDSGMNPTDKKALANSRVFQVGDGTGENRFEGKQVLYLDYKELQSPGCIVFENGLYYTSRSKVDADLNKIVLELIRGN